MTFDGVASVQARISQIEQLVSSAAPVTRGSAGSAAPVTRGNAGSAEFASLLADAMANGTTSSDPLSDSTASDPATGAGGSSLLSRLSQLASGATGASIPAGATAATGAPGALVGPPPLTGNTVAQQFLANALAERGKPYVYGATARIDDPNPRAFDCSELTKWAAARSGVTIPDGATAQYLYLRDHGTTMTVPEALRTPGALLFHFGHEPRNLGDIPADGHVAISLGDGVHTIEARGHAYGTNVFDDAAGRSFNFAGMIPAMA